MSLIMTLTSLAGLHAGAVACPVLNDPVAEPAASACGGGGGGGGGAPVCPTTLPHPANAFACECFTAAINPAQRCSGALPQQQCIDLINIAFNDGLLTADGQVWLLDNGFCPLVVDAGLGPQIYDFCPMGCFAADTEVLSDAGGGDAAYSAASAIRGDSSLVSLADEASLDALALTPRSVDRIVHGPEVPQLYVFTLESGAVLRVTEHHPMVLDSGLIVEASQVADGASFVGIDGRPVAVTSISREPATDDVFNFQTAGDAQLGHVIVAHGVLIGDLKLQNELAAETAAIELRREPPPGKDP